MKQSISYFVVGLLVGVLLSTVGFALVLRYGGGRAGTDGVVLRLGHALDERHPVHAGMVYMAERLEVISGGEMRMIIYANGQLGGEVETLEQTQRGVLDIAKASASALEGFVPQMALFNVPYIFKDADHYWRVLESDLGREMLLAGQNHGLRGLCYYDAGSRSFYTTKRPVLTPDDLRGMQIRVQQSNMAMRMVQSLGGSPTPVPWGELYTALQQGVVDAAENNPPSLYSSRHYEVCPYFSLNEHTRVPDLLLISTATWERLTPQQQEWLQQAADESVAYQRKLWEEETERILKELEEMGVQIDRPDKAPFVARVTSLHAEIEQDPVLGPLFKRLKEIR